MDQQQHRARMARKRALVEQAEAQATENRGVILLLTGNGKGKSTSAFGMVARALGHGLQVRVAQFVKARTDTGEERFFRDHPHLEWHTLGAGFTWETQDREVDRAAAERGWAVARVWLERPEIGLVILDELTYLLRDHLLESSAIIDALRQRPAHQHVVITGRGAPEALVALADTVTELRDVKHAYRAGVAAQPGVDL